MIVCILMTRANKQWGNCIVKRASAGLGLFAIDAFRKGDFVIEYTGEPLTTEEADRKGGKYLFYVDDNLTLDGTPRRHIARYMNHSCDPNCEAIIEEYENGDKKVMIYALRDIAPGEELTYDYGEEYVADFIAPHGCRCTHCSTQ